MRRTAKAVFQAPLHRHFWRLYVNLFRRFEHPWRAAAYYTLGRGVFPTTWTVQTPSGPVSPTLYTVDDLVTLVECFAKVDYPVTGDERVIVDFGSNIGLSALYFLTHAFDATVYLFEPVPKNIERLTDNLALYSTRIRISTDAVGLQDGMARFGVEETGRYGGLGVAAVHHIDVRVRDAEACIHEILATENRPIDIIKLDIEGLERQVLEHLSKYTLDHTTAIYAELFDDVPALDGFAWSRQGAVSRFTTIRQKGGGPTSITSAAPHQN